MNKVISKIMSAFVFAVLGFLLVNRFIDYWKHQTVVVDTTTRNQLSIVSEIEQLKKEKEDVNRDNSDILARIKAYEENVSSTSQQANLTKQELEKNRKLLGMTDVTGPGIVLYLAPKSKMFNNLDPINEIDITYIINQLYYASAEAISINGNRITAQSVIDSSENQKIRVNDALIPINELITIKAIGNADTMEHDLTNYDTLNWNHLRNYTPTIKKSQEVSIPRYNLQLNADGLKPSEKNK